MRSSIFKDDPSPIRSQPTSRTKSVQRKSKSSSPYINTPNSTPTLSGKSSNSSTLMSPRNSGGFAKNPSNVKGISWKLDDLIATYQDNGALPPILSPTLPNGKERNNSLLETVTRPDIKSEDKVSKSDDKRIEIENEEDSERIPKTNLKRNQKVHDSDSEQDENIPLSLLSPTLPSIFDIRTSRQPQKVDSTTNNGSTNKKQANNEKLNGSKVRWINKLNETNKPRFLLRITFGSQAKRTMNKFNERALKDSKPPQVKLVNSEGDSSNLAGLGISTNEDSRAQEVSTLRKETHLKDETERLGIRNRKEPQERKDKDMRQRDDQKDSEKVKEKERVRREVIRDQEERTARDKEKVIKEKEIEEIKDRPKKDIEIKEREQRESEQERKLQDIRAQARETKERGQKLKQTSTELEDQQQKKRDQLQQLTKDILLNKSSQNNVKKANVTEIPISKLTKAQRDETRDSLLSQKVHWLNLSKTAQSKAQSCKGNDELLHIIVQIDGLLLRMVSYDFDERSKIISGVLPSERSWKLLENDLTTLINDLEKFTTGLKEKNLLEFMKILTCILYQIKSVVTKRINAILTKVIQLYISKNTEKGELNGKIIELQQLTISNNLAIVLNFINSKPSYLNAVIPLKFPITWSKKELSMENVQQEYDLNNYNRNLKPLNQLYYLPMGVYTNLNEVSGFLYRIIDEFIEIFNKYNPGITIKYSLQSGLN